MRAELVVDARCELGEGPVWDPGARCLWWTDIDGRAIWRFDPLSEGTERFTPPDRVGFIAVATGGRLLLGGAKALYMAVPGLGGALAATKLVDVEADLATTRANDGRADRVGNVVFGTLDEQKPRQTIASFYQYSSAHGLRRLDDLPHCAVSNSLAFSPDGRALYFTDTPTGVIRCGDYDADSARVTNIRAFATLGPGEGHPDGAIVDADGCLWSSAWGGAVVRRFTPDGRVDRVLEIPTKNPTCPAFGGAQLATIFVTSSRQQHTAEELSGAPQAGGVFALRMPGIAGIADTAFIQRSS
ncbi:MAG TPA: SMP-30/gluconolactonase/LRE family protein [Vicinamibacterales bacterium]|jgi:sugar lactone lactonase YvrE